MKAILFPGCILRASNEAFSAPISFIFLLLCLSSTAKSPTEIKHSIPEVNKDTTVTNSTESKTDYLERIYFSGKDKKDLQVLILTSLEELNSKPPTQALAQQVTFLLGIKEKADAADDACEILDMIAAGLYQIDPIEANAQGVILPSTKGKAQAGDALTSLDKLSKNANSLGSSATSLGWSNYLLTGGSKSFETFGKIGNSANSLSNALGGAKQLGAIGKQLGGLLKKKDKPCKSVPQKDIAIGSHNSPTTSPKSDSPNITAQGEDDKKPKNDETGTTLLTRNIQFDQIESFVATIKNIPGVTSAITSIYDNNILTLQITHKMQTLDLVQKIIQTNDKIKIKVENITANQATLLIL
jgi:hypothetical protein